MLYMLYNTNRKRYKIMMKKDFNCDFTLTKITNQSVEIDTLKRGNQQLSNEIKKLETSNISLILFLISSILLNILLLAILLL